MALPLLALAIQGATSIAGAISASKQKKKLERDKQAKMASYARQLYDLNHSASGQASKNYASEEAKKLWGKSEGASAVGNKSEESAAQDKATAAEMIANTAANIASQQEQHNQQINQSIENVRDNYDAQIDKKNDGKTQNIAKAGSAAANAAAMLSSSGKSMKSDTSDTTVSSETVKNAENALKETPSIAQNVDANKLAEEAKIGTVTAAMKQTPSINLGAVAKKDAADTAAKMRTDYEKAEYQLQTAKPKLNPKPGISSVNGNKKSWLGGLD